MPRANRYHHPVRSGDVTHQLSFCSRLQKNGKAGSGCCVF